MSSTTSSFCSVRKINPRKDSPTITYPGLLQMKFQNSQIKADNTFGFTQAELRYYFPRESEIHH